jgi:hypothetical protein
MVGGSLRVLRFLPPLKLVEPPLILAMLCLGLRLWCLTLRSTILLVEEAGVPGENHRPAASH